MSASTLTPPALLIVAGLALAACTAPVKPEGADAARSALQSLQRDATLAPYVQPLGELATAVLAAEVPTRDLAAGQQAVYVAHRKVELARAQAEQRMAEAQLKKLNAERELIRLDVQAREAQAAKIKADAAAADAAAADALMQLPAPQ